MAVELLEGRRKLGHRGAAIDDDVSAGLCPVGGGTKAEDEWPGRVGGVEPDEAEANEALLGDLLDGEAEGILQRAELALELIQLRPGPSRRGVSSSALAIGAGLLLCRQTRQLGDTRRDRRLFHPQRLELARHSLTVGLVLLELSGEASGSRGQLQAAGLKRRGSRAGLTGRCGETLLEVGGGAHA